MWILLFPVLFMFVILGVIILVPTFTRLRKEKKRTQQLQATAAQLGWNFAASAPLNMIPGLERFALFNDGQQGRQIKNFMYGEASGIKAAVFDYLYLGGFSVGRRGRQIYATSVVYLETPYLRVAYFTLRPENFSPRFSQRSEPRTSILDSAPSFRGNTSCVDRTSRQFVRPSMTGCYLFTRRILERARMGEGTSSSFTATVIGSSRKRSSLTSDWA